MGRRGFTLVELLVVLAVGSILLAIADSRLRISGECQQAGGRDQRSGNGPASGAIRGNQAGHARHGMQDQQSHGPPTPSCDSAASWHEGWLVFVDGGMRGVIDAGDTLLRVQERAHPEVSITSPTITSVISSVICPTGGSQGSTGLANGTFEICVSGSRRDIVINIAGRPRLVSGSLLMPLVLKLALFLTLSFVDF